MEQYLKNNTILIKPIPIRHVSLKGFPIFNKSVNQDSKENELPSEVICNINSFQTNSFNDNTDIEKVFYDDYMIIQRPKHPTPCEYFEEILVRKRPLQACSF